MILDVMSEKLRKVKMTNLFKIFSNIIGDFLVISLILLSGIIALGLSTYILDFIGECCGGFFILLENLWLISIAVIILAILIALRKNIIKYIAVKWRQILFVLSCFIIFVIFINVLDKYVSSTLANIFFHIVFWTLIISLLVFLENKDSEKDNRKLLNLERKNRKT